MIRVGVGGRRAGLWLVLAGLAGLVAAVVTVRAAADPAPAGRMVVARQAIAPGLLIDAATASAALVVVPVPDDLGLAGVLTDPDEALGRRIVVPVSSGEPLTQASLGGAPGVGPAPLEPGQRAVPVPLSAAGGAGLVTGARVDVVASTGEGLAGRTAIVVGDAEVLAVAASPSPDGVGTSGEALLRVSAPQALRITAALNFAREVRLLIRPADEVGTTGPREVAAP